MNRILQLRALKLWVVLVVGCLSAGCSHLNVDFDSSWASRQISVVVVEHQHAPEEVTATDIREILTQSGWVVVSDDNQAQARVVCRWTRQPDLNSESEPVETIKSFHVQVISIERPKMLAVSDYFYSTGDEELLPGVEAALLAITRGVRSAPIVKRTPVETTVDHKEVTETVKPAAVHVDTQKVILPATTKQQPMTEPVSAPVLTTQKSEAVVALPVADVPQKIRPLEPAQPVEALEPIELSEPVSMETSPWVPRFQGMGLEEWGKE